MIFDWDKANETDVREEFLAPLVRSLGYRRNQVNEVVTEHTLQYDRATLGRKKKGDPALTGRIDYLLKAGGSTRWVLEAKSPASDIHVEDVSQVLTYARHPEVSAVYAAVSNGKSFRLYRASQMPDEEPLIEFAVVTTDDAFERLSATLSPDCIRRAFRLSPISQAKPIADGRSSKEPAKTGFLTYSNFSFKPGAKISDPERAHLNELCRRMLGFRADLVSGVIERDHDGTILAKLEWSSPHQELSDFSNRKGLGKMPHVCLGDKISRDPENPTLFDYALKVQTDEGEHIFDHLSWTTREMDVSVSNELTGQATAFLDDSVIRGSFTTIHRLTEIGSNQERLTFYAGGAFEIGLED